jgi:hypothetical protein
LDPLGNWSSTTLDSVTGTRAHNYQNQITGDGSSTANTYDANGNDMGKLSGTNTDYRIYDAWNRLVAQQEVTTAGGSTMTVIVRRYDHDALNRRSYGDDRTTTIGAGLPATVTTTRQLIYSANWQVLEEWVAQGQGPVQAPSFSVRFSWHD